MIFVGIAPKRVNRLHLKYFAEFYLLIIAVLLLRYSAGIGRTGVLITMETAMCLMEANQPVYPLDIVRQMRDQRAMLIQTSVSSIWKLTKSQ